jgi:hypothetical protein
MPGGVESPAGFVASVEPQPMTVEIPKTTAKVANLLRNDMLTLREILHKAIDAPKKQTCQTMTGPRCQTMSDPDRGPFLRSGP